MTNLAQLNDYELETLCILLRKQMHVLETEQLSSDEHKAVEAMFLRRKAVDLLEVINPKHH